MEKLPVMREDELLRRVDDGRFVLFFTADWCPDCQAIKPAMPDIEQDFSDAHFYLVDRDENIDLAADLNIFGIPSFVVFQDGQEIGRFVSKERKSKQQVEDFLRDLK
ncbi:MULTISPECIES: thioredoxin family protein [Limosilactobacillus]|uniref:Thioredoxin family protein n=2 Tax=Limosilactobacillus pontis TaxID=35787 RepID=A0ABU7STI2_9LACO|nr:thioredoxin family protein [Limosilactobacillus pontis]KRM37068.1 thioredoxin domain-containing protein [Limosilactobacillus pontis DSM 8475]MCX2186768.1 thioredoxin family protein [Limosilactobacillus pontis]MCX2188386.1 thioredoxin family protein [Limosilactobacillus pontis]QFV01263.1 thioredoxin [Limosilactobacillus pontis]HJE26516.1 thioredoxin family protein [Limosilactobacillus pontis]